ncbi:MAG: hypothetical protein K9L60_14275 [Methylovulum sp.]|nr:hypothetical protein [Methylovulum sp.]MCF8000097.1 hypothetical protein [Methylovulum sp.]
MKKISTFLLSAIAAGTLLAAQNAAAVSFARAEPNKLSATGGTVKEFVESASHEFNLYTAHGCEYKPYGSSDTTSLLMLTPSGPEAAFDTLTPSLDADGKPILDAAGKTVLKAAPLSNVFWSRRTDTATGQTIEYNTGPLLNLRVSTNEIGAKTKSYWEDIGGFSHHGREQTDSVSALHWYDFKLSDEFYTDLNFRATTARLRGCVQSATVYVPVWQICGKKDYTSFSAHPDLKGSNDFAPSFKIIRNEIANPYPAECLTDTTKRLDVTVTPSVLQINKYLNATKYPGKRAAHSFAHG